MTGNLKEHIHKPPLNALTPFPVNIRMAIDEANLAELAETVKANGVVEPLVVRPSKAEPGKYEVVCGYRRLKAAEMVGLDAVPCIVKEMSDADALAALFIENMQREDFTDYEMGRLLKYMMEQYPDEYPSQEKLAKKLPITQPMISYLIHHYEDVEDFKKQLPPNNATRVALLPERIIREIRRAPADAKPKLVKAYFKSLDEGKHLSAYDLAKMVDSFWLRFRL